MHTPLSFFFSGDSTPFSKSCLNEHWGKWMSEVHFFFLSLVSISVTRVHNGPKVFTRHPRSSPRLSRNANVTISLLRESLGSWHVRIRVFGSGSEPSSARKNEFTTLGVAGPLASRCGKVPMDYDYGTSCLWMAWGIWSFRKCPRSVYCVRIIKKTRSPVFICRKWRENGTSLCEFEPTFNYR